MKFQKIEFQVLILITKKTILDKYYTYILTYQVQYLPSGYPTQSINQSIYSPSSSPRETIYTHPNSHPVLIHFLQYSSKVSLDTPIHL